MRGTIDHHEHSFSLQVICRTQDGAIGAWQHNSGSSWKHELAKVQTIGGRVWDGGGIVDAQVPVKGVEDALQGHSRAGGAAQEVLLNGQPGRGGAWVDVCLGNVALDLLQRVCFKSAFNSFVNQCSLLCKLLDHCIIRMATCQQLHLQLLLQNAQQQQPLRCSTLTMCRSEQWV